MKIYVASSWRNEKFPYIVSILRDVGHEVYDFRNTKPDGGAFNWEDINPNWEEWTNEQFQQALEHPLAIEAHKNDIEALSTSQAVVMVLPCGASSHMELGIGVGTNLHTAILMDGEQAELLYKEVGLITDNILEIIDWLHDLGV